MPGGAQRTLRTFCLDQSTLSTAMSPSAYQLAEDVYVCLVDSRLIFSDLRKDKYHCLNQANTLAALSLIPGFSGQDNALSPKPSGANEERTQVVARALADKGLLPTDAEASPVCVPVPSVSLSSLKPDLALRHHMSYWASFFYASLQASGKLRLQSLRQTARGVENRRLLRSRSSSKNDERLRELVAIFDTLRPYYFTAYLCRFDSLALVEFLAHHNQFPRWVFGVRSQPFAAHCWVQEEDRLLNDSIDYVSQFTPMMAF